MVSYYPWSTYAYGKYDYVSNTIEYSYPDGFDVEVLNFKSLKLAYKNVTSNYDKEHVTPYIRDKSFNKGNFYLDYNTSDIREFDWYNFDKKKKIFSFDEIKYTTILDTSKLNHDYSNISKTIFFKDCSERTRRQIKKSLDQNYEFKEDLNFNDYEKIIKKTFKRQKKKADFNIKQNFKVFEKLHEKKLIRMYKTFKNNEIQALMVVAIINDNSIFINGGRISDRSDDLSFTFNLINSFYRVKDLGVKKFDLEGINSPKRGSYKTGFGGDIYPYYNIKFKK